MNEELRIMSESLQEYLQARRDYLQKFNIYSKFLEFENCSNCGNNDTCLKPERRNGNGCSDWEEE